METVLKWLGQYSAPIALLLALSAALIYLLQNVVEKTIAFQFDRYAKEISLKLEKRSNFEERILLDRYMVLRDLSRNRGPLSDALGIAADPCFRLTASP